MTSSKYISIYVLVIFMNLFNWHYIKSSVTDFFYFKMNRIEKATGRVISKTVYDDMDGKAYGYKVEVLKNGLIFEDMVSSFSIELNVGDTIQIVHDKRNFYMTNVRYKSFFLPTVFIISIFYSVITILSFVMLIIIGWLKLKAKAQLGVDNS